MKLSPLLFTILIIVSCNSIDNQPLTGSKWGELRNGSAEEVVSSEVLFWTPENRRGGAVLFYDFEAKEGNKSLTIYSTSPSYGRWYSRVNLKPWSEYRFTGWIKTDDLDPGTDKGAGIRIDGMPVEAADYKGSNDWQKIEYVFETGDNDAAIVSCMFSLDGSATGRVWFDDLKFELLSEEKFKPSVIIDVDSRGEPLSEYIYGQFIEHLGHCIYGGIWAEMIKDRKFFFIPGTDESEWKIRGNPERVKTDETNSYVGDITPILEAGTGEEVALVQDGLGLLEGMEYTGRIVIRADSGIENVTLTLSSGNYKESVKIESFKKGYAEYPLEFTSGVFTHNASIEIGAEGKGNLYIGTISLMPADNIEGFRRDVMTLLKELDSPVYRWPGGNFVSGYDWKDGIGPRDKRPPRKNPAWIGIEHNDVGLHEFITFCRLLNTEPYIAVNAGLGNVEQARQEVEYCNGDMDTPMGRLRAQNGDPEAWKVKWWSVGNEMYGNWQLGHMSTEEFVTKHNNFAEAMRSVDPEIVLVAVGDVGDWDEMILSRCSDNMDMVSEHFYRQDWHGGGLMTHVKQIPGAIRAKADAHRKYREEIPALAGKDIRICLDEYNYWYGPHIYGELGTRYFLRDALGIAAGMNEFSRQTDIIYMANYAQTVNVIGCIKANTTHSVMAATGQVLKLYRASFGKIPVKVKGETRPLDIAATLNESADTLVISAVNPTWEQLTLTVGLENAEAGLAAEHWSITGPDDMAYNEPGKPEKVLINGPIKLSNIKMLKIAPYSINIYRIAVN
ncbi:MAG: alpha-L-arabinofuranosidase C-terminal domain-containing protein [Bacteroidales bacterium]|nr:alpha-L-arabinofuranosidase C-terminal domain-containing protein [Bacteroidales bacterium]